MLFRIYKKIHENSSKKILGSYAEKSKSKTIPISS